MKRTQKELDITCMTLLWLADYYRITEPYAVNAILEYENVATCLPNVEDLEDVDGID